MSSPLTHTGTCDCGADRCTGFKLDGAHVEAHELPRKRTTKRVTGTFDLTFYGDYVRVDDVASHLDYYLDSGLEDRDDLRTWDFTVTGIEELDGDPDGYDETPADGQAG